MASGIFSGERFLRNDCIFNPVEMDSRMELKDLDKIYEARESVGGIRNNLIFLENSTTLGAYF